MFSALCRWIFLLECEPLWIAGLAVVVFAVVVVTVVVVFSGAESEFSIYEGMSAASRGPIALCATSKAEDADLNVCLYFKAMYSGETTQAFDVGFLKTFFLKVPEVFFQCFKTM